MFVEENSLYRRLNRVWHAFGAITALFIGYTLTKNEGKDSSQPLFGSCFYSTETFLISWGIDIGMKFWVTFIAGLVMYKNMERHAFSKIQAKLFPIYFILSAVLSFIQLAIFLQTKGSGNLNKLDKFAVASITSSLVFGFLNGLWLTPQINAIMFKKIDMEKEEGVMAPNIGSKLGENPQYRKLSKQFGSYHGISTLLNLAGFAGSVFMLYYISLEVFHASRALQMH